MLRYLGEAWGLRDYKTEPQVWDAPTQACEHEWEMERIVKKGNAGRDSSTLVGTQTAELSKSANNHGCFCQRCGAWRGNLGLEPTPELYVSHLVQVFREVKRVLRHDGTLWLNLGDSYSAASTHKGHNKAGIHAHGEECGKSLRGDKADFIDGLKPKDLVGVPWMLAFALRADSWYLRSEIIWAKGISFCPTYSGSVMPESCQDRPTRSHEYVFLLTKSADYFYDADAVAEPLSRPNEGKRKTPARFGGADKFRESFKQSRLHSGNEYRGTPSGKRNLRSVWTINPKPYKGSHFACFPPALLRPMIVEDFVDIHPPPLCSERRL